MSVLHFVFFPQGVRFVVEYRFDLLEESDPLRLDLQQLNGITATYRVDQRPLPVRHSPYVSQAFLDGEQVATYLTGDFRNELLQGATSEITLRYYELAADRVSVVC
ncbi:conserved oligomeric Golgi complex subunit 2 [Olea europaea subsp. europaea]|uniref:Conserved oligomeric Golgi complex subunit 2 n=1 Tax=Olea europaea subsp. europaea TaxID=158383 RepID=A0A8S0P7N0_OLEEU|nr:conserved oligomeric Golgi complex subunit 2 [Olea europaea subsp. europaea]